MLDADDTRKTRLKLRDIHKMRLASEAHDRDQREQAEFVQKMYGQQLDLVAECRHLIQMDEIPKRKGLM